MTADEDSPLRRLVSVPAPHHVDVHGGFPIDSIIDPFQPMIEPAQLKCVQIDRGIRGKLAFTGVTELRAAVHPRTHDQPLQTLLVGAKGRVVQIGHGKTP